MKINYDVTYDYLLREVMTTTLSDEHCLVYGLDLKRRGINTSNVLDNHTRTLCYDKTAAGLV